MFYVDPLGNLLSNLKLSFYTYPEERNFISRMFYENNEAFTRENLVKAYNIIREIFSDILQ
jgi:hypothetical protein